MDFQNSIIHGINNEIVDKACGWESSRDKEFDKIFERIDLIRKTVRDLKNG